MSRTNRRIGDVTQYSAVDRSHGIRMELCLSPHFKARRPFTDFNQLKSQSLHNRKGKLNGDSSVELSVLLKIFSNKRDPADYDRLT
jgi:hypothetical protein